MSIESKIEQATKTMEAWANDATHGYDQSQRWGPDYDCSSAVISAWELADVPVKSKGATYTGNMYQVFLECGFEDVTADVDLTYGVGLQRGDVLLNHVNHTAMYVGSNRTVEASINEKGTTTGGMTGDQTDREFLLRGYRNYPWDCVLRYTGQVSLDSSKIDAAKTPNYFYKVDLPLLKLGMEGPYVRALQELLIVLGYLSSDASGVYDVWTKNAVLGVQADAQIETDGECGGQTWDAVFKAFKNFVSKRIALRNI